MNSVQEDELISYLQSIGFNGESLRGDIREAARKNPASINVRDTLQFGEDRMIFDLLLERDHQFKTYRLKQYKATIQYPIIIDHHLINDIDTRALEDRLKGVDWNRFFRPGDNFPDNEGLEIQKIVSDLWQLTADGSEAGALIQDQLQFKYWPEEKWDDSTKEFARDYQKSRVFTTGPYSITNANLSFYHTSGLIDDVHEQLAVLKLGEFPGVDVYPMLEEILSHNPDHFNLKCHGNTPDGYIEYDVLVRKIDGWFSVDTYAATLTPYPPIVHGVYNGIDSKELEAAMRGVNWRNEAELFIFHEDREPEFLGKVGEIQAQIFALSQDLAGAQIADQLQLKYWTDASFFDSVISQSAWDYLEQLPKISKQFGVETDAVRSFNLLCGRPVLKLDPANMFEPEANQWYQLKVREESEKYIVESETISGISLSDLAAQLRMLPHPSTAVHKALYGLIQGDRVTTTLNNDKKVFITVSPEKQTINLFSTNLEPIR